ncbi:putative sialic acid transporter [compost metagenome]
MKNKISYKPLWSLPVIVAALGYFVDIYDLLLFGIVRVPSLQSLGFDKNEITEVGTLIVNWQMGGLLLGGILWGILGDKRGRLSVLFGSIVMYSLANVMCGFLPYFPNDKENLTYTYVALRFIAGIGLAGELGAGITLVSEVLPKELRALGTSLVAGVGLSGAVVANLTVKLTPDWNIAYFIGGAMGIGLLLLRIGVLESGIFNETKKTEVSRGNFLLFFTNWNRFWRYLRCIFIGLPTWFCIGILAMFGNVFGEALGIKEGINPGDAIMWGYIGISVGDIFSGILSHWLESRRKSILWMMGFTLISVVWILSGTIHSAGMYYFMCCWFGFGTGYWAMFVTIGAEQFGTNIRSTAATTIPNMVRGMVILMTISFEGLMSSGQSALVSAAIVGAVSFALGIYSTWSVPETHGRDLDFVEE